MSLFLQMTMRCRVRRHFGRRAWIAISFKDEILSLFTRVSHILQFPLKDIQIFAHIFKRKSRLSSRSNKTYLMPSKLFGEKKRHQSSS